MFDVFVRKIDLLVILVNQNVRVVIFLQFLKVLIKIRFRNKPNISFLSIIHVPKRLN